MIDQTEQKRAAARAAIAHVPERGVVGLGSGSTAKIFVEMFAELVKSGRDLRGVPSSRETAEVAQSLGIPLLGDDGPWDIAICFDGADEVDPALNVIKGGGGALTREKIVIASSSKVVLLVDESKLSERLGEKWHVPVEVLRFGHAATASHLARHGAPTLRCSKGGEAFVTDQGGLIYDVKTGPITQPFALESALQSIPGVVTVGLFCARADAVIVAAATGVREMKRP